MFSPQLYKQNFFAEQRDFSLVITGPMGAMGAGKTTELFGGDLDEL